MSESGGWSQFWPSHSWEALVMRSCLVSSQAAAVSLTPTRFNAAITAVSEALTVS